jgi:polysaccharide export outer membrane protein
MLNQTSNFLILILSTCLPSLVAGQVNNPSSQMQIPQQSGLSGQGASSRIDRSQGPSVAPEDVSKLKLAPGSSVAIRVFEEPDLDGIYRLDAEGNVSLPLAGQVNLSSLSLREAEAAVSQKLQAEQILRSPHVVVNLDEYSARNIVVLGEVAAPGRYPTLGDRKLMDVLALAGGQTPMAGNEIVIHRFGQPSDMTETIHYGRNSSDALALNLPVNPGDSILVKRAGIVYVLGSVNRPGGYVMQEEGQLNVDEALALALGTAPEAKVGSIRIFRKQPDGGVVEFLVNYRKINNGKSGQVNLKAEDIIYVPPSAIKTALIRGTQVVASAASATIYSAY